MRFRCNIGWRGRALRVGIGVVLLADAWLLHHYRIPDDRWWSLALQGAFVLMGAFAVFEGTVGWCAVRALGIRTRF